MVAFAAMMVLFVTGVPSQVLDWSALAMVPLGVFLTARIAPRIVPSARCYPPWRRGLAGIAGIVVGGALVRSAQAMGLDADALSHDPSILGVVQETVALTLFYGGMAYSTFLALGTPTQNERQPSGAAEQSAD